MKKLCGGEGCKNVIVTGDSAKCDTSYNHPASTEVYCFPSQNIRIFKSNDSYFIDSNASRVFYFDGYDNVTFENLSLEIYPSSTFLRAFNWLNSKEKETNNSAYANSTKEIFYNSHAKSILSEYILPHYDKKIELLVRPKSNIGDYTADYDDDYFTSYISAAALAKTNLKETQFVRLGSYFQEKFKIWRPAF